MDPGCGCGRVGCKYDECVASGLGSSSAWRRMGMGSVSGLYNLVCVGFDVIGGPARGAGEDMVRRRLNSSDSVSNTEDAAGF